MTVRALLDCSTDHLSLTARGWLSESSALNFEGSGAALGTVSEHLYGWFMAVPLLPEDDPDTIDHGIPDDLHPIIRKARELGCDFILFDADAEEVDGLPVYNDE